MKRLFLDLKIVCEKWSVGWAPQEWLASLLIKAIFNSWMFQLITENQVPTFSSKPSQWLFTHQVIRLCEPTKVPHIGDSHWERLLLSLTLGMCMKEINMYTPFYSGGWGERLSFETTSVQKEREKEGKRHWIVYLSRSEIVLIDWFCFKFVRK